MEVAQRLENCVALITGGSRGIGRAIAGGYAREGADIAIFYRQRDADAQQVVEEVQRAGRRGLALRVDTTSREQIEAGVEKVCAGLGAPDVLVNSAGIALRRHFLEITDEDWDRTHDVNLKAYFMVGQVVGRIMAERRSGVIINMSSIGQQKARRNRSLYAASKGGVLMLTRGMAVDLAPHGIRVNALVPGPTETDMIKADLADPAFRKERESTSMLGRLGRPDDLVGAAIYLASEESSFVTGSSLIVDGGATAI